MSAPATVPPRTRPTLRAPALAALISGGLAAAVTLAVILLFDAGFCDGAGFGCLGAAVTVVFVAPPVTALLIVIGLAAFGVPRAWLVGLLSLAGFAALAYSGVIAPALGPLTPPVAFGLSAAVLAGLWAFALQPGRSRLWTLVLVLVIAGACVGSTYLDRRQRDQASVDQLAATGAPAFVLDDPEWLYVGVTPGDYRIQLIYDAVSTDDVAPRITITTADRPAGLDPDSDCAAAARLVIETPAPDRCDRVDDDLWRVTQGGATSYLDVRGGAVVGLTMLYPEEFSDAQLEVVLGGLREVSYEVLAEQRP